MRLLIALLNGLKAYAIGIVRALLNQRSEAMLLIPSNDLNIQEGYYSNDKLANLLRDNKYQHEAIHFIADMIEDGEDTENSFL